MRQTAIPYLFMRGGTSRGPYFNRADLPEDRETLSEVLIAAIGAGHPLNIDGLGGGAVVTAKVAMLSHSADAWAHVDFFFAQLGVSDRLVDYRPTCGNILIGVAPAALEMGLIEPAGEETTVRIRAVNTEARIAVKVQTPGGIVRYDGDHAIDGVPGTAAPVELAFMDIAGAVTGSFLPTGNLQDVFEGITVTCMDAAMPIVIARADAFGKTGHETAADLDADTAFMARMEAVRLVAGAAMGMGNVSRSVTPKFALLAPPREGGIVTARYFQPWNCHPSMAVTGAQCLAACTLTDGTVAEGLTGPRPDANPARVVLEHPVGTIEVLVDYERRPKFHLRSAGLVRTARKLAAGEVFIPGAIWPGKT